MNSKVWHTAGLLALALTLPVAADTLYSNLQDIPIPTNFDGVMIDVDGMGGWDLNPFFGGVGVANSPAFQPARTGSWCLDPLQDFAAGATIDGSCNYSTLSGGSDTHLGTTFTAGQEGFLGFRLNGNYGWMRVVFTGNEAGAVVKDWAYNNSGAAIVVGEVQQNATSDHTLLVTLAPTTGRTLTLGSVVSNNGAIINRVVKADSGTAILTRANTYSGTTTVSDGTLLVNNLTGSGTGSGTVQVDYGATLGGTGRVAGALNVTGVLAPGGGVATLVSGTLTMNGGSTFQYSVDSGADLGIGAALQQVTGDLNLNSAVALTLTNMASTPSAFNMGTTFSLINYAGAWNRGLFTYNSATLANGAQFCDGLNVWQIDYDATTGGSNFSGAYAGGTSGFVNITAIPESRAALLGCLGLLILLRRWRSARPC